jgi:hypothetical protein
MQTTTTVTHPDGSTVVVSTTELSPTGGSGEEEEIEEGSWLPLESNPEVLNPFVHRLGLPETWGFHDVYGLDPDLLMMVPQPCAALCLLFPSGKISHTRR